MLVPSASSTPRLASVPGGLPGAPSGWRGMMRPSSSARGVTWPVPAAVRVAAAAALARGLPVLAICRGIQELNVALGGSLHQEVHKVPGRMDHRAGSGTHDQRYAARHEIAVTGRMARILGKATTRVNSLHGQAIDRLAPGLAVEATAPDGTIEAVHVSNAPGWAFGVQWHPEWRFAENEDSMALFRAFGEACRAYRAGERKAA